MKKLNLLYLHCHDAGRYIQPYGYAAHTPALQTLAEEGVLFRQCFCANPTCSPSRAALLTGQCAHSTGMLGLAHRGWRLHDNRQYLAHYLREHGYVTALSARPGQHVTGRETVNEVGYERVLGEEPAAEERPLGGILSFLEEEHDKPFFLDLAWGNCHRAFRDPEPPEDIRYARPPECLPDLPEVRADMAAFYSEARRMDGQMGMVLDSLMANGLAENTIILATTDHGIPFPRMKCSLEDSGIGVYCMMKGPGGFSGGKVIDALVSQVDLFPTLCDLLNLSHPDWLQGHSLVPLVTGKTDRIRDEVFAEVNYHAAYEPKRCIRTDRWKYIRRYDDRKRPVLPNTDDSPSKDLWLSYGWRERAPEPEALYDLVFDPNEAHNLVSDPACAEVLNELRARLDHWMKETDDPILNGPIPPLEGSRHTDPDAISNKMKPL